MRHRFHFSRESQKRIREYARGGIQPVQKADAEQAPEVETVPVLLPPDEPETDRAAGTEEAAGLCCVFRTDIGNVRRTNQDTLILGEKVCGVADGMGGHSGGEVASAGARDGLLKALEGREPGAEALAEAICAANTAVFEQSCREESLSGMGTTMSVLWMGADKAYVGQVGDSRCYLLRGGELRQVTEDHSMVMEMVRAGVITREQAAVHPLRNVITRAVGTDSTVQPDTFTVERRAGDLWLLCSDGLYGMMTDADILRILLEGDDLERAADALMALALENGGRDNVSLVLLLDREGADE